MKIIISPAKSLDFESNAKTNVFTQPSFLKESSYEKGENVKLDRIFA